MARERGDELSLVTAYRTIDLLVEIGLARRVHHPDGCQGYVLLSPGHYHVAICRVCGRVTEFAGYEALGDLEAWAAAQTGFRIDGHMLQLYGICSECQRVLTEQECARF